MNKQRQLLIRACKSKNPLKRLRSIYRRFYLDRFTDYEFYAHVGGFLLDICVDYDLYPLTKFVSDLEPKLSWMHGIPKNAPYKKRVLMLCISKIKLTETSKFQGLTRPLRFRNGNKL